MNEVLTQDVREREERIRAEGRKLLSAFEAIAQDRSDYQLAHFVVGPHNTLARQWWQIVLELRGRIFNMAREQAAVEKYEIALEEARHKEEVADDEFERRRASVDARLAEVAIQEANLMRLGHAQEAETLFRLLEQVERAQGKPFTRAEIEADEERYWKRRLAHQAYVANRGGVLGTGNAEALLQTLSGPGEEPPQLIGDNELHALLGISPDDELKRLLADRDSLDVRIAELRGAPAGLLRGES